MLSLSMIQLGHVIGYEWQRAGLGLITVDSKQDLMLGQSLRKPSPSYKLLYKSTVNTKRN